MVFALVWDENSVFQVVFLHRLVSFFLFFFSFYFVLIPFFLRVFFFKAMNRLITIIRCLRCTDMFILNFIFLSRFLLFAWFIKVFIKVVLVRTLLPVWILLKRNEDSVFGYRHKSGLHQLTDFIGVETNKKRKRRTSFTPQALELLNAHFDRNTHPNGKFSNCHLSF